MDELIRELPFEEQPIEWSIQIEEQELTTKTDEAAIVTGDFSIQICYRLIYQWILRHENGEEVKLDEWEASKICDSFCVEPQMFLQPNNTTGQHLILSQKLSKLRVEEGEKDWIIEKISSFAAEFLMEKTNADLTSSISVEVQQLSVLLYDEASDIQRAHREFMRSWYSSSLDQSVGEGYDPWDDGDNFFGTVPASASSIGALEKVTFHGRDSISESCLICLEEIDVGLQVTRMPCTHTFHGDCITRWLETSHYCPLCRFEMPIELS